MPPAVPFPCSHACPAGHSFSFFLSFSSFLPGRPAGARSSFAVSRCPPRRPVVAAQPRISLSLSRPPAIQFFFRFHHQKRSHKVSRGDGGEEEERKREGERSARAATIPRPPLPFFLSSLTGTKYGVERGPKGQQHQPGADTEQWLLIRGGWGRVRLQSPSFPALGRRLKGALAAEIVRVPRFFDQEILAKTMAYLASFAGKNSVVEPGSLVGADLAEEIRRRRAVFNAA